MNYEDELERARAKRSRRRENGAGTSAHTTRVSQSAGSQESGRASDVTRVSHTTSHTANGVRSTYRRRKKKNGKARKIIIGVLIVLALIIGGVAFAAYNYINSGFENLNKEEFDPTVVINPNISEEQREKMEKGFWTVAVFGVDSRDNSLGKGNQSDVIMIANLNRETGEIKLVSVYRDTYLNINDRNTYNKINAAYAAGGPEAAVKALNKNLDLNITHYATFNWKAVATVINILGGVEIDISPSEFYYINAFITETVKGTGIGSVQLTAPGTHNLDGVQAVAYGRLRLMDSDYARTERQRIVIQKAFEKVKTADLATLNSVVGHVFEMSATNIQFGDLAGLVKDINKYHLGETSGFPAARGEAKIKIGSNKLSCVIPQTLESNVISLHNFLYGEENYSPSSTVKEISAKIAEISGLATEAEEIGHVAVDKGYVPKATTAAATVPATESTESASETSEEESTEETSEGESGESESTEEGESGTESETESSSSAITERPTGPSFHGPSSIEPTESEGPKSPSDMTSSPAEGYGPGSVDRVPEATTAASGSSAPGGQTAVTIIPPSSADSPSAGTPGTSGAASPSADRPGTSGMTNPSAGAPGSSGTTESSTTNIPSSPADVTISSGNTGGPASQATTAAGSAPGM